MSGPMRALQATRFVIAGYGKTRRVPIPVSSVRGGRRREISTRVQYCRASDGRGRGGDEGERGMDSGGYCYCNPG